MLPSYQWTLRRLCGDKSAAAVFGVTWLQCGALASDFCTIRPDIYIFRLHQFGKDYKWSTFLSVHTGSDDRGSHPLEHGAIARNNFSQNLSRFVISSLRLNRGIASEMSISFHYRDVIVRKVRWCDSFWNLDRPGHVTRVPHVVHARRAITHLSHLRSFI